MIVHDGTHFIIEEIKLKCRAEIRRIEDEAKAEIDKTNSSAQAEIDEMKGMILGSFNKRAESEANKLRSRTNVDIRRMKAEAMDDIIRDAVSGARDELMNGSQRTGIEHMNAALAHTMKRLDGQMDKVVVFADRGMTGEIRMPDMNGHKVEIRDKDIGSGIIIFDERNNVYFDYSLDAMIKSREDSIRKTVSEVVE